MHSFTHISIRPSTRYTFTRFLYVPPPTHATFIHPHYLIYLSIYPSLNTHYIYPSMSFHTHYIKSSIQPCPHHHTHHLSIHQCIYVPPHYIYLPSSTHLLSVHLYILYLAVFTHTFTPALLPFNRKRGTKLNSIKVQNNMKIIQ